jgi:hypothetical protein
MAAITQSVTHRAEHEIAIPWYLWCLALAVASSSIGGRWDVSWHQSIGRDTFWTPAHMAIYLCGVLAGIACGYLILKATFRRSAELMATPVRVMGLSGPLGAFLTAWGGLAMLTSAPFDNWWHNAYGLDVKIISPPHTLLILGNVAIQSGALLLVMSALNRAEGQQTLFFRLRKLMLCLSGFMLMSVMFFCTEYTRDVLLHSFIPYIAVGIGVPLCFAATWKASRYQWAATSIATIYTAPVIAFILILPLLRPSRLSRDWIAAELALINSLAFRPSLADRNPRWSGRRSSDVLLYLQRCIAAHHRDSRQVERAGELHASQHFRYAGRRLLLAPSLNLECT